MEITTLVESITSQKKENMTDMTITKKFLDEKNDNKKLGGILNKSKEIVKKLKKPKLSQRQVEKYISTKRVNVMTNTIATLSVDRKALNWSDDKMLDTNKINMMKNWYNYYSQIENNLVVGAKAVFLVCRDLYEASQELSPNDYKLLKANVHISESTISKYAKIGSNTLCSELFLLNKLPEQWTSMYKIAKQKDADDIKKIKASVNLGSTAEDIDVFMGVVKKVLEPLYKFDDLEKPEDFIRVAYDKTHNVDPIALNMLKKEITELVYNKIDDFNSIQKTYFFDKKKNEDVRVQVACNEKLMTKAYATALEFLSKIKGKDKKTGKTSSMTAFETLKARIENPVMESLTA